MPGPHDFQEHVRPKYRPLPSAKNTSAPWFRLWRRPWSRRPNAARDASSASSVTDTKTSTSFGSGRSVRIEPMSAMRSTPGRFAADLTNLNTSSRNRSRPPAESREREECRFLVCHKSCDRLAAHLEEPDDVVRRAITQPNPDHLRWRPEQDTQPVKVLVLGHDDESVIASIGPDCTVRGGGRLTSLTWTEPGYRSASASTRRAARFSSKSSLGGCSGSRTTGVGIPRAFAVLRLTVKSTFVGCSTGRSPGFAPLKILSTWVALCGRGPKTSAPYWRSPPLILLSCAERVVRCPLAAVRRRSVRHLHVPSLPALNSTIVPSEGLTGYPERTGPTKGNPGSSGRRTF